MIMKKKKKNKLDKQLLPWFVSRVTSFPTFPLRICRQKQAARDGSVRAQSSTISCCLMITTSIVSLCGEGSPSLVILVKVSSPLRTKSKWFNDVQQASRSPRSMLTMLQPPTNHQPEIAASRTQFHYVLFWRLEHLMDKYSATNSKQIHLQITKNVKK